MRSMPRQCRLLGMCTNRGGEKLDLFDRAFERALAEAKPNEIDE